MKLNKKALVCKPAWLLALLSLLTLSVISLCLPQASQAEVLEAQGFTEAYQDSKLGVSVNGTINKIHVQEGDFVKAGQLLLELEQQQEKIEVQRRKIIWQSKAELNAINRQLENMNKHLTASRELYQTTGSIPREELENQELEQALAEADLERTKTAENREQTEYEIARQQLKKRNLRAPFNGWVADLIVGIGENCEIDTPLIQLVNSEQVDFIANVELSQSLKLKPGEKVKLLFSTTPEPNEVEAEIVFISPVIDPASGLRKVKARFKNQEQLIVPGMAGTMQLELSQ